MTSQVGYNDPVAGVHQCRELWRPGQAVIGEAVDHYDRPAAPEVLVVEAKPPNLENPHCVPRQFEHSPRTPIDERLPSSHSDCDLDVLSIPR